MEARRRGYDGERERIEDRDESGDRGGVDEAREREKRGNRGRGAGGIAGLLHEAGEREGDREGERIVPFADVDSAESAEREGVSTWYEGSFLLRNGGVVTRRLFCPSPRPTPKPAFLS